MATLSVGQEASSSTIPAEKHTPVLRFITAGSVDDGKSTLIGRLLYDAQSIYEDQLISIQKSRINRAEGPIDFSLLTDGLRAEREQGITIDVAYRYFSTARRKFIIADTPGHEQYTRNMVTGASTVDAAVILIDARKGLLTQSRRHTYITSLLGIQYVVAAINKMDLVGYSEEIFIKIANDFQEMAGYLKIPHVYAIPISALKGDGVVTRCDKMPWSDGPPLLEHLENIPGRMEESGQPLRLPIQFVIRPDSQFRGFAGQIASGGLKRGDIIISLPSRMRTRVKSITSFNGEMGYASAGQSINITLEDELDLGRGDLLVEEGNLPQISVHFVAHLVWLHSDPSQQGRDYLLKHTTRILRARLRRIHNRIDVNTLHHFSASDLKMNDIARVEVETTQPLFFDAYKQNRTTGSFILIDPITNATVAAGMIIEKSGGPASVRLPAGVVPETFNDVRRLAPAEPLSAAIWITGRQSLATDLECEMVREGWPTQLVSALEFSLIELRAIAKVLHRMQVSTIFFVPGECGALQGEIESIFGTESMMITEQSASDSESLAAAMHWLRDWHVRAQSKEEHP